MDIFLGGEVSFDACKPFGIIQPQIRRELKTFFESIKNDNKYGTDIINISIITMIMRDDLNQIPERILIRKKKKEADIRLRIDYDKFISGDYETQRLLYCKNIIDSILLIKKGKELNFEANLLANDIMSVLSLKYSDFELL